MVNIHFTIDATDIDAVRADLSPHFPAIHFVDFDGLTVVTLEASNVAARHIVSNNPKTKVVFPGPNGFLDRSHVDELSKGKKLKRQHKKGDQMRDALSTLFDASGHDAHNPEWN